MERHSAALSLLLENDTIMLANNEGCKTVVDRQEVWIDSHDKVVWHKWNDSYKENIKKQHIGYDMRRVVLWNEMKSWIHKHNGKNKREQPREIDTLHFQTPEMVRHIDSH
ncbi:hypothetical protein CN326_04235 [Bacillus sp. AFS018417]|uniref:hypothetical protein n=1 Tax=Bacillus sp. AFS018417 TaxID=2033491 RepID=UPI000BF55266|nr:hypothetical protein [Bacillus sp. AFS018417]PEZ08889.1 hypothetical protein CN326_04235 [Bacillus sp. AFS018417]